MMYYSFLKKLIIIFLFSAVTLCAQEEKSTLDSLVDISREFKMFRETMYNFLHNFNRRIGALEGNIMANHLPNVYAVDYKIEGAKAWDTVSRYWFENGFFPIQMIQRPENHEGFIPYFYNSKSAYTFMYGCPQGQGIAYKVRAVPTKDFEK